MQVLSPAYHIGITSSNVSIHTKDKEKVMRGLDHEDSAQTMLDGMRIYYNFIRPHMALNGKTPAEKAKISKLGNNKWKSLIKKSKQSPPFEIL